MIRPATHDDIPRLIEMGREFFDSLQYPEAGKYNPNFVSATFSNLIDMRDGVLLVDDNVNGAVGALIYPFYMTGRRTAQELFWWVDPGHRGIGKNLLVALEEYVKSEGVTSLVMLAMESSEPDRVGKVYERAGYRPMERTYIKEL